jgi:hypothetical protein
MLNRGLTEAITRGQTTKAEKYRAAIASLPQITGLIVREEGKKILLENVAGAGMVPVLQDDFKRHIIEEAATRKLPGTDQDRPLDTVADDFRRVLSADGTINGNADEVDLIREQFNGIASEASLKGYLHEEPFLLTRGGSRA